MDTISELGGINPKINNSLELHTQRSNIVVAADVEANQTSDSEKPTVEIAAISNDIDRTKLLELLGPSVSEKYGELISAVSANTSKIHDFIKKVNKKLNLYI